MISASMTGVMATIENAGQWRSSIAQPDRTEVYAWPRVKNE